MKHVDDSTHNSHIYLTRHIGTYIEGGGGGRGGGTISNSQKIDQNICS